MNVGVVNHDAGPAARSELITSLRRAHRSAMVLPDDWPLVDQFTLSRAASRRRVDRAVRRGDLVRVHRGAYALRSPTGTLGDTALALVGELTRQPHLVTGGAALNHARFTDQVYRRLVVLVAHPQRSWAWMGQTVQYVRVPSSDLWGGRPLPGDPARATVVARAERAILDAVAHPLWGVTFSEAARALSRCLDHDPTFVGGLAEAARRYSNTFLARRIGCLVEMLADPDAAIPLRALRGASKRFIPLDPSGDLRGGVSQPAWRVIANATREELLELP